MAKPAPTLPPKTKTLAQQQTDFTAEGSPPPGKVATTAPLTPVTPAGGGAGANADSPRKVRGRKR